MRALLGRLNFESLGSQYSAFLPNISSLVKIDNSIWNQRSWLYEELPEQKLSIQIVKNFNDCIFLIRAISIQLAQVLSLVFLRGYL